MPTDSILTSLSALGECLVLVLALRRGLWRGFPVFTGCIAWSLLTDLTEFLAMLFLHASTYFRLYTYISEIDFIFCGAVLVEIAWSILSPILHTHRRAAIVGLIATLALTSALIWPLTSYGSDLTVRGNMLIRLFQARQILTLLWFLGLAVLSRALSLAWPDRARQIALGLSLYTLVSTGELLVGFHLTATRAYLFQRLHQSVALTYLGVLIYWTICFWKRDRHATIL